MNHYITSWAGKFYDPSYGSGPFDSTRDHAQAAADGVYEVYSNGGISFQHVKKNGPDADLNYHVVPGL